VAFVYIINDNIFLSLVSVPPLVHHLEIGAGGSFPGEARLAHSSQSAYPESCESIGVRGGLEVVFRNFLNSAVVTYIDVGWDVIQLSSFAASLASSHRLASSSPRLAPETGRLPLPKSLRLWRNTRSLLQRSPWSSQCVGFPR